MKAFLQGAYSNGTMTTILNNKGLIPLTQPYSPAPWNYEGLESVPVIPQDVVDWVLVELRNTTESTTLAGRKAAFIKKDGSIVDIDGNSCMNIYGVKPGSYYVVLRHRNHLSAMSSVPIPLSETSVFFDFSNGGAVYGNNPLKDLGNGAFGLYSGDTNADNKVRFVGASNDRKLILTEVGLSDLTNTINNTYSSADVNLDGMVKFMGAANDRNPILTTVGVTDLTTIVFSQVP